MPVTAGKPGIISEHFVKMFNIGSTFSGEKWTHFNPGCIMPFSLRKTAFKFCYDVCFLFVIKINHIELWALDGCCTVQCFTFVIFCVANQFLIYAVSLQGTDASPSAS